MKNSIWGDEDNFTENPSPYENGQPTNGADYQSFPDNEQLLRTASRRQGAAQPQQAAPEVEEDVNVNEIIEQYQQDEEDEEADHAAVLADARLRLEQGRLYEMIMEFDIFQEIDADPRAIKNVCREIRSFARERMEVMLGMRQTVAAAPPLSQFNDLQIDILKKLVSKATGGISDSEEATEVAAKIQKKQVLKPISQPVRTGLKPVSQTRPSAPKKELQKQEAPLARKKTESALRTSPNEEEKPIGKPVSQMSPKELEDRNLRIKARQAAMRTARPANALPMPSADQEAMIYAQRVESVNSKMPGLASIISKVNSQKRQPNS